MANNNLSAPVSYLPLQNFHIIPIIALDPASIKTSAKKAKCDREKIKYNTLLNAIAKALGVKGGFAEYQRIYDSELVPFMNKHGMKKRVDLLKQRHKGFDTFLTDISHQDLSERLFFSSFELPVKIFTGYNFDYKHTIDDGDEYFNSILCGQGDAYGLQPDRTVMDRCSAADLKNIVEHNINITHANPNIVLDCPYDKKPLRSFLDFLEKKDSEPDDAAIQAGKDRYERFASRTMLDLVVGSFIKDLNVSFNLLGDSLLSPVKYPNEPELYWGNGDFAVLKQQKELATIKFDLFRERIEQGEDGWIDVIPFNQNLIFLRGGDGQYDFVFKNQREKVFEHQIFGESLKRADIPSFMYQYQFLRWHYFEYQGWRYMDYHNAENFFYNQAQNSSARHPGVSVILQSYHEAMHHFKTKPKKSSLEHPGFKKVAVSDKKLMISNLITINDLHRFKEANSEYLDYRVGDKLGTVNAEFDNTLPASVTWFDALAYINWLENETELPIRLLNLAEYESLRSPEKTSKGEMVPASELEFVELLPLGNVFPQHPPYMSEESFQKLTLRFRKIELNKFSSGLYFVNSNFFAEWLQEGTCIRSGNLKSFYNNDFHIQSKPPLNSTGKYKGVKIGFRLCYELVTH